MKLRLLLLLVVVIVAGALIVAVNQTPDISTIEVVECVQSTEGDCIRFPIVSGDTLNGETVTLPDFFTGAYNIVIVPFDREQQEGVIEWLPVMQDLQAEYDELRYYSVGALPDLPAGVRLLISGGMSLAVDSDVRDAAVLIYLEDQTLFADSLGVDSLDETQLFILNGTGEVIWQTQGAYSKALADSLREQVAELLTDENS